MKIKIFYFLICYCGFLTLYSCNRYFSQKLNENYYPAATNYATILYAKKAIEKTGSIRNYADHFVVKGDGEFRWAINLPEDADYNIILDYSVHKRGAIINLSSGGSIVSNPIVVTNGVYLENKDWYQFNCERKLIPGKINLKNGINLISLQIDAPDSTFETIIYAVELVSEKNKESVIKETKKAVAARPQMNWFTSMKYGVMFHWTSLTAPRSGPLKSYKDAVNDFDVSAFVKMVEKTGADYVIFTGCWAETYIPAPLKEWEKVYPGHTTERDLISELSDSLRKNNIRFILYLSTHVYAKYNKTNDKEFESLNNTLISEIGKQYKNKIDGYWFDGWYQSYQEHSAFDFQKFYKTCKIGNSNRVIALNSWLYPIVTEWQDYWAGEVYTPGANPTQRIIENGPGKGLQFQSLIVLEDDWAHTVLNTKIKAPRLKAMDLINYISSCSGKGPVTINVEIYQDGSIDEAALTEMEKIKLRFK